MSARGGSSDCDRLSEQVVSQARAARAVLIGSSTEGTAEFHELRCRIARLLIERKGFTRVAADWDRDDASVVDRFIRGESEEPDGWRVIHSLYRWPCWARANSETARFVDWLREWNRRAATRVEFVSLDALVEHADPARFARTVVWTHDLRVTGQGTPGEVLRKRLGDREVYRLGMATYEGELVAADDWGEPYEKMRLAPARPESFEALLHRRCQETGRRALFMTAAEMATGEMPRAPQGFRRIGAVYNPARDRQFYSSGALMDDFDGFVFLDETDPVEPVHVPFTQVTLL